LNSFAVEQGRELEDEAIAFAALEYGYKISKLGFCESDDGRSGCSPDGLIGDHSGIEMKCPRPATHVRYLVDGVLPKDYAAQVHGSMLITGRAEWVFFSYCRDLPPFHLLVKRDEAICAKIAEAIAAFATQFDEVMHKLNIIK
jgi:exodeoxyribonuclease (lambda-induced)